MYVAPQVLAEELKHKSGEVFITLRTTELPAVLRDARDAQTQRFFGIQMLIVNLEIVFQGKPVFVPLDAFWGLTDPRGIEVRELAKSKRWQLVVNGGDASTSYRAAMEFDRRQVHVVRIYSPHSTAPRTTKLFAPVMTLE
jgi:hypothetical protein